MKAFIFLMDVFFHHLSWLFTAPSETIPLELHGDYIPPATTQTTTTTTTVATTTARIPVPTTIITVSYYISLTEYRLTCHLGSIIILGAVLMNRWMYNWTWFCFRFCNISLTFFLIVFPIYRNSGIMTTLQYVKYSKIQDHDMIILLN